MNDAIIRNYNQLVKPEDTVYFLGDLTLLGVASLPNAEGIMKRLPGKKIFIYGNHDKLRPFDYVDIGFESAHTSLVLEEFKDVYKTILVHDPAAATYWNKDILWLCGHIHTIFKRHWNIVNVGVDVWDFKPVSYDDVMKLYKEGK
jgi:calcineurin-like phosphoesterase family protein